MRLLLTAQGDWNLYACGLLAQRLQDLGCQVFLSHEPYPSLQNLPYLPVWQGPVLPLGPEHLATSDLTHHVDAIGVFAAPEIVSRFRQVHHLACTLAGHSTVPIFSGPVQPLSGDLLEEDLLGRLGCDLLCLHGPQEVEVLQEIIRDGSHPDQRHVQLGLWQLPAAPNLDASDHDPKQGRSLVFIEQCDYPASQTNRKKLITQLESLARVLPDWTIVIQPDYMQPEDIRQLNPASLARLLLTKSFVPRPELPPNLILGGAGGLPRILATAAVTATLTSSIALASLIWGKPVICMADYGFSNACNSPLWLGSGLIGRLAALSSSEELLELPAPHPEWLRSLGASISDGAERLLQALQQRREVAAA